MKRFFWMLLIFIFIFSLTALFADEEVKKVVKTEKVAVEKVSKKVSEMPKVKVKQNQVVSSNVKQVKKVSKDKPASDFVKKPKALPINENKTK